MRSEGHLIADRYRLCQMVGGGAMGEVWLADDEVLDRAVAVKLLALKASGSEDADDKARQRAMREGRIAARLRHPNAIAVHDVTTHDGAPVLILEYLPSRSLATVLAEQGVLSPLTVAGIGAQVAAALAAAHEAGIVHRDLKPGNILLAEDGTAKITDFGISRAADEAAVTESGVITGTPAYFAPEIVAGGDLSPAADVFSLGATLYAAVEGEPPFGADEPLVVLHRIAGGRIVPPRQAGTMTDALVRMLKHDPADRPTMTEAQVLILQAAVAAPPAAVGSPWYASPPVPPSTDPPATPQVQQGAAGGSAASAAEPTPRNSKGTRIAAAPSRNPRETMIATAAEPRRSTSVGDVVPAAGRRGRPRRRRTLVAGAATLIVALAGLLATGWATQPAPTTADPPKTKAPSPQEIENVVRQYYSLVPENLDQAYELLGPRSRSLGKDFYKKRSTRYVDTNIVSRVRISGNTANFMVDYTFRNGDHASAPVVITTVPDPAGRLLINIDQERTF